MTASKGSPLVALLAGLMLVAPTGYGQTVRAGDGGLPLAETGETAPVEPAALAILKTMGDLLRASRTLSFTARGFREEPATTGQTVAFFRTIHVQLQRPDRARIDVRGDMTNVSLWYDGKTVTLFDPLKKAFGSTPAPPSVEKTIAFLSERFGTVFTIAPFLEPDPFAVMSAGLATAFVVGEARVDGVVCDQLAFTEQDVDWQLWVQRGRNPLPRRVAVTFNTRPGAPREFLELSDWKLGAPIPASAFVFSPPPASIHAEMIPQPPEQTGPP
jgi:hypothetical protein